MTSTAIRIHFDFTATAEQLREIAMPFENGHTIVTIDGTHNILPVGPELLVPCAPGGHHVEVHFMAHPNRLAVGVANLVTHGKLGHEEIEIDVPDGTVVDLHYAANAFWFYGGKGAKLTAGS